MLRSIPGDDSGLLEELVLLVDRDFIRERVAGAEVTRTKWFTSSLEQMELVKREGGGSRSDHVIGDKVSHHQTHGSGTKISRVLHSSILVTFLLSPVQHLTIMVLHISMLMLL